MGSYQGTDIWPLKTNITDDPHKVIIVCDEDKKSAVGRSMKPLFFFLVAVSECHQRTLFWWGLAAYNLKFVCWLIKWVHQYFRLLHTSFSLITDIRLCWCGFRHVFNILLIITSKAEMETSCPKKYFKPKWIVNTTVETRCRSLLTFELDFRVKDWRPIFLDMNIFTIFFLPFFLWSYLCSKIISVFLQLCS